MNDPAENDQHDVTHGEYDGGWEYIHVKIATFISTDNWRKGEYTELVAFQNNIPYHKHQWNGNFCEGKRKCSVQLIKNCQGLNLHANQ